MSVRIEPPARPQSAEHGLAAFPVGTDCGPDVERGAGGDAVPTAASASDRRCVDGPRWHAMAQIAIVNYAALRRYLGREAVGRLADALASQVAGHPGVVLLASGRELIDFAFETDDLDSARTLARRVFEALHVHCQGAGGGQLPVVQLGVAAAPADSCDETRLIEAAESARVVAADDDGFHLIDLSREDVAFDHLTLMRELPQAIAEGEMFLHYQPKLSVRKQQVAGVEALIRWQHPTRGLILPGDFISVAEQAGEIGALTLWTLRQVIADQRRLAAAGHDIPVFINVSGVLLADAAFVAAACAIIADHAEAKLGFEITETAVIRDPDSAIRHLKRFADSGVALAIDDYGAGLSSLAYLKQLPAKELKIDKMFVTQLTSSNRDPLIVRSTIDLAHALEMEVTAEGVETPSALALLSVMGCDMVQGYLISRPVAFDGILAYLDDQGHLLAIGDGRSPFIRPESLWKRA
jgi:diguanylate cyclase